MEKLLVLSLVILWLQLAKVNSQQGEQNLQTLSIQEGENVTMNCSYKSITITALQWYRQDSRQGFVHLILMRSNERQKYSGRLHFTLDNSIKSSSLSITASQAEDAATYLCAADPQCSVGTRSPSRNLPELSLRSRNSVQSWWFCLPTKESLQTASNTKGSSSQIRYFRHIIGVAAFSFLSLNKGFRLDEPKDPSSPNFTRSPLEDEEGLLSKEGLICYMCSPLTT
ncbi:uncharacterized protein LOC133067055 [Dama dama]|uniref:uncharacterized protein LOC133067055 n=1 Tax=Dama dama TaxID=30532 RepID=UPI002A35ADDB|nr:uncharacterized protein LOC133067055 [Dama dama]